MKFTPRQERMLALPWVTYVKRPKQCTAIMYRKSHKHRGPCRNPAHWRFRALKSRSKWAMNADSGIFCWSHLIHRGVYGTMDEEARTFKKWYELGILCQSVNEEGIRCVLLANHEGHKHRNTHYVHVSDGQPSHTNREWD